MNKLFTAAFLIVGSVVFAQNTESLKIQNATTKQEILGVETAKPLVNESQKPLIFIDGKPAPYEEMQKMSPDTIESMYVYKGKQAVELFGENAKNGAIDIKLKKQFKAN